MGGIPVGAVSSYARKYQFFYLYYMPYFIPWNCRSADSSNVLADNFAVVDASIRQVGNFLDEQELVRPSKEVLLTDDGFHFEHVSFGYDKKKCCMI